jgi:hypothetical protein
MGEGDRARQAPLETFFQRSENSGRREARAMHRIWDPMWLFRCSPGEADHIAVNAR